MDFKPDILHLCCHAFVQEEIGPVSLLLFVFCCQGCFSGGQIQSCLGQPSSWFSIVVWNCSPWCLSRKGWFTERGRGCVWEKGKGRSLCLDSSLNHFFGFFQQLGMLSAWVTLLSFFHEKGQKINVLAWKTGGRTNKMLSVLLALWEENK